MKNSDTKILGVIPARFSSSRFPGKILAEIMGKSLIRRTYERALQSRFLTDLIVATDDERIRAHVVEFGGKAVMTSPLCSTGTDRVAEAVEKSFPNVDHVVNIQGDEPLIEPETIDKLIQRHLDNSASPITTPVTPLTDVESLNNPGVVKCVFDKKGHALYFSRSPIPYPRNNKESITYYRHVGIYCFRRDFLLYYAKLGSTPLSSAEDLEQLRVLENGFPISVVIVEEKGVEVNYPEDIAKVEALLCQENTSL